MTTERIQNEYSSDMNVFTETDVVLDGTIAFTKDSFVHGPFSAKAIIHLVGNGNIEAHICSDSVNLSGYLGPDVQVEFSGSSDIVSPDLPEDWEDSFFKIGGTN